MTENANPPRGEKGDFRKLSVTMPPMAYARLVREAARRKIAGESNQLVSALVREAVIEYLERLENEENRGHHSAVQAGLGKGSDAGHRN
jgi:hypothetical protein